MVVPANTFIGTSEAVTLAGGKATFADCDPDTQTITPETVEKALTSRTRAIMPVHLYGNPAPAAELKELADSKGLFLVEDVAQAHGARYQGAKVGSFGHAATFSFYPGKNLGAYGDGGCVVTDDPELAKRVKMYALSLIHIWTSSKGTSSRAASSSPPTQKRPSPTASSFSSL